VFVLIVGAGKVGRNTGRLLAQMGHEVVIVEQRRMVYDKLLEEFQERMMLGDGTEIWMLERAGIARADMVVAVTGDDEDNIVISQIARMKFAVPKVVARVNNPYNQPTFDLMGIEATVCAATRLLSLIEHELPEHKLVHLLNLKRENIELVELEVSETSPFADKKVYEISLPDGVLLSAILRDGTALLARGSETILPGDQVLCLLEPGKEKELIRIFLPQELPETVQAEADLDVERGFPRQ
jgi:trk system potassium uptake protein TrkA